MTTSNQTAKKVAFLHPEKNDLALSDIKTPELEELYEMLKETIENRNIDIYNEDIEQKEQEQKTNQEVDPVKAGGETSKSKTKYRHSSMIPSTNSLGIVSASGQDQGGKLKKHHVRRDSLIKKSMSVMGEEEEMTSTLQAVTQQVELLQEKHSEITQAQSQLEERVENIKKTLIQVLSANNPE